MAGGVDLDAATAVRGGLGVPLDDLGLDHDLGRLTFLLNGGFALLLGVAAYIGVARRGRKVRPALRALGGGLFKAQRAEGAK
jgi:hypothetical protein